MAARKGSIRREAIVIPPSYDPERLRGPNAVVSVDPEFLMRMSQRAEQLRQHLAPPDLREAEA